MRPTLRSLQWGLALPLLAGCNLSAPSAGTPVEGRVGVADAVFEVRSYPTEVVRTHISFPSLNDGRADSSRARRALILVQGGLVEATEYRWLAHELAARGYVVAIPEHPAKLSIFSIDVPRFVKRFLRNPPEGSALDGLISDEPIGIAGHSLGGVTALKAALADDFGAVALLASLPDGADAEALVPYARPVLSLAAKEDCSALLDDVRDGYDILTPPAALMVLSGLTHFQFTNSDRKDRERDCPPTIEIEKAHERIASALTIFFETALDANASIDIDQLETVPGSQVSSK